MNGKKETAYALFYSLVSKIATYVLLLIFANFYIASEYGLGNFAYSIWNLVALVTFLGLPASIVPFMVKRKNIGSILRLLVWINLAAFIIGLFISLKYIWILPLVLVFPLVMISSLSTAFWISKSRQDYPFKVGLFSTIFVLISAYLLKDLGKLGFVSAYAIGNLFSFFAMNYPIRREIIVAFKKTDTRILKSYLKLSMVVLFGGSIFVSLGWVNTSILGMLDYFEEVAQFGIATAIAGLTLVIPNALSLFILTRAGQVKNKGKSISILHRVVRTSFFASFISSIFLIIFSPLIINIFFNKYIGIEPYIAILSLGMIFFSAYYIIYMYHIGMQNPRKVYLIFFFGFVVNLILALVLTPLLGVLGSTLAMTSTHLFILLYMCLKENIKRVTLMSLLAIFVIFLVYILEYWALILVIFIIPLSIKLKVIEREDIKVVRDIFFSILKPDKNKDIETK